MHIMSVIAAVLFFTGAGLLVFGFRKNNRALLTIAAFLWLLSGMWSDFAHGFDNGLRNTAPAVASSSAR